MDRHLDDIVALVRAEKTAVIVAPPGSGKTTRIPPALTALGRTILLQPRRIAARALARRIAFERKWTLGEEIGWQIRFERRFSARTQLLVATEGILTARLQSDPLLSEFAVVVLDEFHERSIHADLALALAKQAADARGDLALVVMSATIDAQSIANFLGARVIDIDAKRFPVDVRYAPGRSVADVAAEVARDAKGHVLCFLPGVREIDAAALAVRRLPSAVDAANGQRPTANVLKLHGTLDVDEQERALAPSSQQKIILATNIAETSLTVDGVTDVIDSGLHKVMRFDPETALDHLVTEQISLDSAAQRAGRAGRTQPGRTTRLWDERAILRPHREPEVRRVDLTAAVLDILAWGGDPRTFAWFERPPEERIESAMELLRRIGPIEELHRFPLHPRLARVLIDAHGSDEAVRICAELSGDLAHEMTSIARRTLGDAYRQHVDDVTLRRAFLAGYPDRVAMRRESGSSRVLLSSGTGAVLAREIDTREGEFLVALDVVGGAESLVKRAMVIERDWLTPTHRDRVHAVVGNEERETERIWYDRLLLAQNTVAVRKLAPKLDPELQRRIAFAGDAKRVNQLAPERLALPSGRTAKLEYRDDGSVVASVKLQELFGLAETPLIGPRRTPVTFALLAPNGRPVQITRDLKSFWSTTYQDVRKELRGRYPRHPWPDDPWTAQATHRTKKR
ncbi:MAG TPA: ATP-dependent helicase C-terminal domain-containing protein [Thermoanaerobaculia bacterium]|nr:ATP-dependent helicase C-terminal domain-containing protein [Thermoanaerobaculia bacterium]